MNDEAFVIPPPPEGWAPFIRESYTNEEDTHCGFKFWYQVYDESEYETCGEPAVACDLEDDERPGRCDEHLSEFIYLLAHGFVPEHKSPLHLTDKLTALLLLGEDEYA